MDKQSLQLVKIAVFLFSVVIGGAWIWSWANPQDYSNPPVSEPPAVSTPAPLNEVVPNSNIGIIDPCEDAPTVEEYKLCLEDMALEDWMNDRRSQVGEP